MSVERESTERLSPFQRADREQEEAALRPLLEEREKHNRAFFERRIAELEAQRAATEDADEIKNLDRQIVADRIVLESLLEHDSGHDKVA